MESQPHKEEGEDKAEQSADQSQPERTPIRPTEPSQGKNATEPSRKEPKKRCWRDKRWRHPQVIVNGALAFVAVVAAIIYYCQLRTANSSFIFAQRNARLEARAWVTVPSAELIALPDKKPLMENEVPYVEISLSNTGKTPALQVTGFAEIYIAPAPKPPSIRGEPISNWIISPTSANHSRFKSADKASKDDVEAVTNGTKSIFASGIIYYCDIFKMKHWTSFCVHVEGNDSLSEKRVFLSACTTGNKIDETPEKCESGE